ncbi:MAG: HAD-IA family hydrolase [Bacteroidales bacterium]|jgi:HAD superfamily hydrolase (TIGR01549 family)|nr:HAD-IA family hydrolase [Bacteroidales bacterium]
MTFNIEEAKKQIDEHEIISFDVFDTLSLRPYVQPSDLFRHMEESNNSCKGFTNARLSSESVARNLNALQEDIYIDDIYQIIPRQYKKLKEVEINFEKTVSEVNPEMRELYEYAQKKRKRIIIVSDMYLPSSVIAEMLHKSGYVNYEKLYVSSTVKKTKRSSNLYNEILKDIRIEPSKILHIGDNRISDCKMAKVVGIDYIFCPKIIDRFFSTPDGKKKSKYSMNVVTKVYKAAL